MPYAIYLRKSRADAEAEARGEGETLARHERALMDLAKRRDYPIVEIYREIVSGESISNRPQMRQLLADVAAKRYDGVLVMEVERLARGDTVDQATVANTFRFSDTLIITPFKTYDPNDATDEDYFEFSLFMSRREYKTIVRRMQTGRKLAAQEGKYIASRAPYGYDRVKHPDGSWTLAVNSTEAPVVRQIFEWYANGLGSERIAGRLNQMGLRTKYGRAWQHYSIPAIIRNPIYKGYITWDKRVKALTGVDGGQKQYKRVRNAQYTCVKGLHEAIVPEDLFERANTTSRRGSMPLRTDQYITNPFAGLVVCGVCGHAMCGLKGRLSPSGKPYPYRITCRANACTNIGCAVSLLEDIVLSTLDQWATQHTTSAPSSSAASGKQEMVDVLRKQLVQLQSQRSRLCDLLERGIYDDATYMRRSAELAAQISSAESAIAAAAAEASDPDPAERIRAIAPLCADAAAAYRAASAPEDKNRILRRVVSRIIYIKTKRGNNHDDFRDQIHVEIYPA